MRFRNESNLARYSQLDLEEKYEQGWEVTSETYYPCHPTCPGKWCYIFKSVPKETVPKEAE